MEGSPIRVYPRLCPSVPSGCRARLWMAAGIRSTVFTAPIRRLGRCNRRATPGPAGPWGSNERSLPAQPGDRPPHLRLRGELPCIGLAQALSNMVDLPSVDLDICVDGP